MLDRILVRTTLIGGTYTHTYLNEDCLLNGDKFVTNLVKRYEVDVNAVSKDKEGIEGNTYHIVDEQFNNHYSAYYVTLTQYDSNGNIVQVNRWQFPKNY